MGEKFITGSAGDRSSTPRLGRPGLAARLGARRCGVRRSKWSLASDSVVRDHFVRLRPTAPQSGLAARQMRAAAAFVARNGPLDHFVGLRPTAPHPRPKRGILVAMTVMKGTLDSRGS